MLPLHIVYRSDPATLAQGQALSSRSSISYC